MAQCPPRSSGWIIIQGFGAMNPTAVKRAAENEFPMDHLIGNWWAGQ